jgi:hypothetical protein
VISRTSPFKNPRSTENTPSITATTVAITNHNTINKMPFNFSFCGIVALALLGVANAHMKMSSPVPFNVANLDNSPLKADGSDFPCKTSPNNPSSYSISAMNKIPVNEPVLLSFEGSAVHGGGTCELSISMDKEPTANSVFKVIQVFQGACPTATGGGLTFNIPKEFPNAERATLAWTWFNQIGNREMYMNCAPIEITGGSDNNTSYYESLPSMFVANVPTSSCTTEESTDPTMPNPGNFVIQGDGVKPGKVTGPKCGTAAPAQNQNAASGKATNLAAYSKPAKDSNVIVPVDGSSGSGSGSGGGEAASSAPGGNDGMYTQPAATSAQTSAAPTAGGNDGMYSQPAASPAQPTSSAPSSAAPSATAPVSSASSAAPPSTFSTMTVPAPSAAAPPYPTLSPTIDQGVSGPSTGAAAPSGSSSSSSGSSSSSSSSTAGSSGQCTTDGAVICNGPTQFGLCNGGSVVWQATAAGTQCSNGVVQKRSQPVLPRLPRRHAHGYHKVRAS